MSTTRRATNRPGRAVAVAGALLLCLAGGILWALGGPQAGGQIGGPFQLQDAFDRPVTERSFHGRFMLIYFGYTTCPDVCPTTLHEMAVAMQALGPAAGRVQPMFVTVDPNRDTPAVLHDYVGAIDPAIVALTGPDQAVNAMLREYHVHRAIRPIANHPGSYLMDHSSVLYLMGPDGRFVAPLRADLPGGQMAREIAAHLL